MLSLSFYTTIFIKNFICSFPLKSLWDWDFKLCLLNKTQCFFFLNKIYPEFDLLFPNQTSHLVYSTFSQHMCNYFYYLVEISRRKKGIHMVCSKWLKSVCCNFKQMKGVHICNPPCYNQSQINPWYNKVLFFS